ncbi:MAG: hypothetical protein AABX38_05230 [Candidatus Micrarchaeota archaeon]
MAYSGLEVGKESAQKAAEELLARVPKRSVQIITLSTDVVDQIVKKATETAKTERGASLIVKKELFLYLMRNSPSAALEVEREWYKKKGVSFSDKEFNSITLGTKQTFVGANGIFDQKASELAYREASVELRKLSVLRTKPKSDKIQRERKLEGETKQDIVGIISNPYLIISKLEQKVKEFARRAPQVISERERELNEKIVQTIPKQYQQSVQLGMDILRKRGGTLEQQELYLKFVQSSKTDQKQITVKGSFIAAPIAYIINYIEKKDFNPKMLELLPAIEQTVSAGSSYINIYNKLEICLKFAELAVKKANNLDNEHTQKIMRETVILCDRIISQGELGVEYLHDLSNLVGKMGTIRQLQKFLLPALDYISKKEFMPKEEMISLLFDYFGKKLDGAKVEEFKYKVQSIEEKFGGVLKNKLVIANYGKADYLVRKLKIKRDWETIVNFAYAVSILGEQKTQELHNKNGIVYFARYSPKMLEETYANLDPKRKTDKPILVVAYNKNDWNGAFYEGVNTNMQDLTKHYKLIIYEVNGEQRFYEKLLYTRINYGKINTLIIGGHGEPGMIQMGDPTPEQSIDLGDSVNLSMVYDVFDRKDTRPKVILVSCSTGKNEGAIGGLLSKVWGADLEAPKIPTNIKRFDLAADGKIEKVVYGFSSERARFVSGKQMKANFLEDALSFYESVRDNAYASIKQTISGN